MEKIEASCVVVLIQIRDEHLPQQPLWKSAHVGDPEADSDATTQILEAMQVMV